MTQYKLGLLGICLLSPLFGYGSVISQPIVACRDIANPANCACQQEVTHEPCGKGNITDIVSKLPKNITSLTLEVNNINHETQNKLKLSRFPHLEELTFKWIKTFSDKALGITPTIFDVVGLFNGPSQLRTLKINIPTKDITRNLLWNLTSLQNLDLADTAFLSVSKFVNMWYGSRLSEKPIERVILRNIVYSSSDLDIEPFNMSKLMPIFRNIQLKELDMSENGDFLLYPGFIKYTPMLEVLNCARNKLKYDESITDCVIAEMWLHRNLKGLDISDIVHVRPITDEGKGPAREIHSLPLSTMRSLLACQQQPNCTVCQVVNSLCGHLIGFTPCELLPSMEDIYHPDTKCTYNITMLFPPKLEKMSIANTVFGFLVESNPGRMGANQSQVVCFQDNQLNTFNASHVTFPLETEDVMITIYGWEKMEVLDMRMSDWVLFLKNHKLLHAFPGLLELYVSGSPLGEVIKSDKKSDLFSVNSKLQILNLKNGAISDIPHREFGNLWKLRYLDLSGNKLLNVTFYINNLTSLRLLNVSNNAISHLSVEVIDALEAIRNNNRDLLVDLSGNDLSCACQLIYFVEWLKSTEVNLTGGSSYLCDHPKYGGKIEVHSIDTNELKDFCHPVPITYIIVGTVPALLILLIVLLVYAYNKRWKIRFWIYALRHTTKLIQESRGQFHYDGFVVYNEGDRDWVHRKMLGKLEGELDLKLCVHFRDFIPGHNIEDQIVSSISQSRKTVLILSPNFLESNWCDFEMQMARNRLFADGLDVLVLVMLANIPMGKINKTLRNLLEKKTYLVWNTENKEAQDMFWRQLRLALCPAGVSVRSLIEETDDRETSQRIPNTLERPSMTETSSRLSNERKRLRRTNLEQVGELPSDAKFRDRSQERTVAIVENDHINTDNGEVFNRAYSGRPPHRSQSARGHSIKHPMEYGPMYRSSARCGSMYRSSARCGSMYRSSVRYQPSARSVDTNRPARGVVNDGFLSAV